MSFHVSETPLTRATLAHYRSIIPFWNHHDPGIENMPFNWFFNIQNWELCPDEEETRKNFEKKVIPKGSQLNLYNPL